MKKRKVLSVLALACLAMSINLIPTSGNGNNIGLEASTIDYLNEKENIERVSIRRASDENTNFDMSSTYVQWAHNDEDGYDYMRFATALAGDYESVSYTRHIAGIDDETHEVTAVYKGISAAGETTYRTYIFYGSFIQTILNFLIIAFSVFCIVKVVNRLYQKVDEVADKTKDRLKEIADKLDIIDNEEEKQEVNS